MHGVRVQEVQMGEGRGALNSTNRGGKIGCLWGLNTYIIAVVHSIFSKE